MNFPRYKYAYLIIIIASVTAFFVLNNPLYEAVIDISLSPPENARKTDFSWITVNEWFISQTYIITSHSILKDVDSDFSENKLKRIVRAKRLGAADIMRISVRSEDNPEKLTKLAGDIAVVYLKYLQKESAKAESGKEGAADVNPDAAEISTKNTDALYREREKIVVYIKKLSENLKSYDLKMKKTELELQRVNRTNDRIRQIESELFGSTQRLAKLKEEYTDNWPEVASVKEKVDLLTREKEALAPQVVSLEKLEYQKLEIQDQVNALTKSINAIKERNSLIDKRIAQLINASSAVEKEQARVKDLLSDTPMRGPNEPAEIINPPTVNFLPDLGIQLTYGVIGGYALWFLLNLLFCRIEERKNVRSA